MVLGSEGEGSGYAVVTLRNRRSRSTDRRKGPPTKPNLAGAGDEAVTSWKVKDVAAFLQASESWVRHAAAGGRLPCVKIGGLLRFDPDEIRALARSSAPARAIPRTAAGE